MEKNRKIFPKFMRFRELGEPQNELDVCDMIFIFM